MSDLRDRILAASRSSKPVDRIRMIAELMDTPTADVHASVGAARERGWQDLVKDLDSMAQSCVELAEYIEYRGAAGLGDHGHEDALKQAKAKLKKVRKAMGYTCP